MYWTSVISVIVAFAFWKCYNAFNYWKRRGIPQKDLLGILRTNWKLFKQGVALSDIVDEEYKEFPNLSYYGSYEYLTPTLIVRTPDAIKQLTVKDFEHFADHRAFGIADIDPLWARNLVQLEGEKWREMRTTLSPAFTSSKMRSMFVLIIECAEKLANHFAKEITSTKEIEMKDVLTRYTNDVIASTAFGVQCDSLAKRDNEFYLMGKEATNSLFGLGFARTLLLLICPKLYKLLGMKIFTSSVHKFFTNLVKETIRFREKEEIIRPDMIHLLMEARKGNLVNDEHKDKENETGFATVEESMKAKSIANNKKELTDTDITAQALLFFLGGFDTVSTAMSFMAYELATNPEIQQKLYEEIADAMSESNGTLTYETVVKLKYLDMVVSESIRKWPPALVMNRMCTKPYTINSKGNNGKKSCIDKGTHILISQFAIHRDEKYYPDPERFDPERFNDENKKNIQPYTYIPFGSGPRNCIGSRFALLKMKAVFVYLLMKFEIVTTPKTAIPIKYVKQTFNLKAPDGYWVGLKPRT